MAKEWIAYDVKARKKVKLVDPKLVTMKNGRKALKGKSKETGILCLGLSVQKMLKNFHQNKDTSAT